MPPQPSDNHLLDLVSEIHTLTTELARRARTETQVRRFANYPEFYRALNASLINAEQSLRLTHIRDHPPTAFRMESTYYGDVEEWAVNHPACAVRRVIAITNDAMAAWAEALAEVESNIPNFHIRSCEWSARFPMINMAIVDKHEVYLALSGESPEETAGIVMLDEEVGRYFVEYYDNLWRQSTPLPEALARYSANRDARSPT